ncbi:FecR/PupR family sigma factor regulator [Pseudomonas sp. LRF_L74]|uniref:FecR/PupR family sigma factor regulator n=1 Tax=Pseudomonas sp. LRF_L74 TaxID=3369422 RepID=UPI003F5E7A2E
MRLTAVSWYVRLQNPQLAASDRIEFRRWLDSDTQHVEAFSDVERLWQTLDAPSRRLGESGWYRPSRWASVWQHLRAPLLVLLCLALLFAAVGLWREADQAHQVDRTSSEMRG